MRNAILNVVNYNGFKQILCHCATTFSITNVTHTSVRNKQKISLVRRTSNFENLLVRQSQHLSKQFPWNEAHGLALALG